MRDTRTDTKRLDTNVAKFIVYLQKNISSHTFVKLNSKTWTQVFCKVYPFSHTIVNRNTSELI